MTGRICRKRKNMDTFNALFTANTVFPETVPLPVQQNAFIGKSPAAPTFLFLMVVCNVPSLFAALLYS